MAIKILLGIPPKAHVSLASDEIEALQQQDFDCHTITYGRNNSKVSALNKMLITVLRAFKIVLKLYQVHPSLLYLNSRFEPAGSTRDFISILIVRIFYWSKLPIVIKSHGSNLSILEEQSFFYKRMLLPFLFRNVSGWIFLSQEEKQIVLSAYPSMENKVWVLPNIIEPSRCKPSDNFDEQYNFPKNKFKVLFVGRMVEVKGVFDLLNAIPQTMKADCCIFIFVGDGDDFDEMKQTAESLKINQHVRFMGYLPDAECDHFYANSDMLVFPTFDTEGFPMALFKSVALGLPIATTKIRAAADHLKGTENTLWVNKKSPLDIAQAIDKIVTDKALREAMRENNIRLGKNFSIETVGKQMANMFHQIINAKV